jgi:hypothetical protein
MGTSFLKKVINSELIDAYFFGFRGFVLGQREIQHTVFKCGFSFG